LQNLPVLKNIQIGSKTAFKSEILIFDKLKLQRYLDDYIFRFNRRTCKSIGKRFWRIMQQAAVSAPITWRGLMLAPTS